MYNKYYYYVTVDNHLLPLYFSLFVSRMTINLPYMLDTVKHHPDPFSEELLPNYRE